MSETSGAVALVRRDETAALATGAASAWTRDRIDLIKRTICPKGITDDEFALFIDQCKRSGLDPLLKQAYCVPRRKNIGSKDYPKWLETHEFQPSEAGMLARAEKFPDLRGVTASAVYEKDAIEIDAGAGTVSHRFKPGAARGKLLGAWALLVRDGRLPIVVWLDLAGYQQGGGMWAKIPATMIEKCARVAVLRKAYPEQFGGIYIKEEMPAEEFDAPAQPAPTALSARTTTPPPSPARAAATNARAMRIWRKAQGQGATDATFAPWVVSVLGHETPSNQWTEGDMDALEEALQGSAFAPPAPAPEMVEEPLDAEFVPEPPAEPEQVVTVRIKGKDTDIRTLKARDLEWWADKLTKDAADPAKARWRADNERKRHAIQVRLGEVSA